jgi:enoyl-CoA hydratase/carnithine racemase
LYIIADAVPRQDVLRTGAERPQIGQAVAEFINPVYDYARDVASNVSPRSLVVIKRQVYESMFQPLQEGFDASEREMLASLDSLDFKEGVAHYLEKRSPAFVGR